MDTITKAAFAIGMRVSFVREPFEDAPLMPGTIIGHDEENDYPLVVEYPDVDGAGALITTAAPWVEVCPYV